jgi:hypothetical protein
MIAMVWGLAISIAYIRGEEGVQYCGGRAKYNFWQLGMQLPAADIKIIAL